MKPILSPTQQDEVCEAVAKGASLDLAAVIAGCTSQMIDNTLDQDLEFDHRLEDSTVAMMKFCYDTIMRESKKSGNQYLADELQAFMDKIEDNFQTPVGIVTRELIELEEYVNVAIANKQVQTTIARGIRKLIRELPPMNFHTPGDLRRRKTPREKPRDSQ